MLLIWQFNKLYLYIPSPLKLKIISPQTEEIQIKIFIFALIECQEDISFSHMWQIRLHFFKLIFNIEFGFLYVSVTLYKLSYLCTTFIFFWLITFAIFQLDFLSLIIIIIWVLDGKQKIYVEDKFLNWRIWPIQITWIIRIYLWWKKLGEILLFNGVEIIEIFWITFSLLLWFIHFHF